MIYIDDVSYKYSDDARPALDGVTLRVLDGEFLAIVGHNGSGKSTLAKHLNGLLLPASGSVTVDGMDTRDEAKLPSIRQLVGMVFQNPDNQMVTTIVEEDVAFGPENLGVPTSEMAGVVEAALRAVNMEEFARSSPSRLSGGQKQRVAIAGMLAMKPRVLVLDEATAMLDPLGRREVLNTVRRLNKEEHITVVMITQYMEEAVECDRVAVMADGKLLMADTPRAVFARGTELRASGLDVPEAVKLRDELRMEGAAISANALTAEELADEICQSLLKN